MVECEFCGAGFENENKLHLHWAEHKQELNSHQKEKLKKAERRQEESKKERAAARKRNLGYFTAGGAALALIALLGLQILNSSGGELSSSMGGQPTLGDPNASVTVVGFGDYRCPVCEEFHNSVFDKPGTSNDLKGEFIDTGEVKFHFVNYAFLDGGFPGDTSETAAVAAECTYRQDQDQYWNMHDAIYENQGPENEDWATEDFMMQLARNHTEGINYEQLNTCITNKETLDEVRNDKTIGDQAEVTGTPSVYVNGEKVNNWRYSNLKAEIESELEG